jgi:cell division protein FtsB
MGKLIRFKRQRKAEDEAARALFPPFLTGATDARPASFKSDASPSVDSTRPGANPRPEFQRKQLRKQRGLVAALVVVFLGGTAAAFFGDHGYLDVRRQRRRYNELKAIHAARLERVDTLRGEISRLEGDPAAIERIARDDLGYVAKGELTLLLPGEDPGAPHGLDAKGGSGIVPAVRSTP